MLIKVWISQNEAIRNNANWICFPIFNNMSYLIQNEANGNNYKWMRLPFASCSVNFVSD